MLDRQLLIAGQDLLLKYKKIVFVPTLLVAILVAYFTFLACSHVWFHYRVMQLGYQLGSAQSEQEKLHQDKKRLTIEAASATTPGVLLQLAADPFAMQQPAPSQLRRIIAESPPPQTQTDHPFPTGNTGITKETSGDD